MATKKGAFTGADHARDGLIKEAHRGTLFLDEVGELPPAQQKAFLRVLQERLFRPVGGKKDTASDFRLIAATNRGINGMVEDGTFREDLLFRLQTLAIQIPALRASSGDIRDIASFYIAKMSGKLRAGSKGLFARISGGDYPIQLVWKCPRIDSRHRKRPFRIP